MPYDYAPVADPAMRCRKVRKKLRKSADLGVREGPFFRRFYNFYNFHNLVINGFKTHQNRSKTALKPSQDAQLLIPEVWRDLAKLEKIKFPKNLVFRL